MAHYILLVAMSVIKLLKCVAGDIKFSILVYLRMPANPRGLLEVIVQLKQQARGMRKFIV